ncbi:hypothetical protein KDU71_07635 [Carboxylicivirga sediminis]|uniref:Uncharacterized protein n=1 Tax=Carboxylicivirga sediminis TaxID=2006564 RepID=A0A941F275_9BACT|nr:hypothetical protein [Carboxylicivirga sediminis]MBR8535428.1 hypothetical protein [Carboxylicivirga sediminis]
MSKKNVSKVKTYRYKDLSFPVSDNDDVYVEVKFKSNADIAATAINVPGPNDKEIEDSGIEVIGKGKDLRSEMTSIVTVVMFPSPVDDNIAMDYFINGKLIVSHDNPKTESENPIVVLLVKFPKL